MYGLRGVGMEKDIQILNNNVITKSNVLIEANYKLTTTEQKIVLYLVSKVRKDDSDFQTYTLPIKQFCELLGHNGTPKYSEMKKITKKLIGKVIEIKEGKKLKQMSWLSYVEYNENEGSVNLSFDPRLKPYLLELKREFTSYKLKNVMELKSSYSIRLYEILKKWQLVREVDISLSELRKMVGAGEKYQEYHNFKKRVLTSSQDEIAEKTDITFDYVEIKKGRKVSSIHFTIHSKVQHKNNVLEIEELDEVTEGESWFRSLYTQLQKLFGKRGYTISKDLVERWLLLGEIIWGKSNFIEINKLSQEIMKKDNVKNHIAFQTYILNEKVKCINNGQSHQQIDIENSSNKVLRSEMLPEWFNDYKVEVQDITEKKSEELDLSLEKRKKALEERMEQLSYL